MGVPHEAGWTGQELFFSHVHLHRGPAPVRRYLPKLSDLAWNGKISRGKVFDLTLPLDHVAEAYRAMNEHPARSRHCCCRDAPDSTYGDCGRFNLAAPWM